LELCQTLLLTNIPLNKLNNEHFRKFLEKYIKVDIPDESTLRKNYDTMQKIRDYVGNKKNCVSMDETTDVYTMVLNMTTFCFFYLTQLHTW